MLYHANAIFSVFRVSLGCPVVSIQSRFDTKSFRYKVVSIQIEVVSRRLGYLSFSVARRSGLLYSAYLKHP